MKRMIWMAFAMSLLLLSGCSDSGSELGQPCTEEKFCENGVDPVCGEDGATYACSALAVCEGVTIDSSGEACGGEPAQSCGEDGCVPMYCGPVRGYCIRESELATMGACPPQPFQPPEPQCECTDEECGARICDSDTDCGDGLCVATPEEDRSGYCVNATCDQLEGLYDDPRPEQISCEQDSECVAVSPLPSCCGFSVVNQQGADALRDLNGYLRNTSCGEEWMEMCAVVDCAPMQGEPKCIQGTCQFAEN